jgi:transcriptional regulator with XRE-family HTH domain
VTKQAAFDVGRQIDALTRLRKRSGKGRSQIAVDLGMETDTYRRYENGQTDLRVSQIDAFARVYGVTPAQLIAELGFELPAWSPRAALEAAGLDPDRVDGVMRTIAEWDEADQRAEVASAIREHQEAAEAGTRHRPAS